MDDLVLPLDFSLPLSAEDAAVVRQALTGHLEQWYAHFLEDAGATHTDEEWEQVRVRTGRVLWRLEEIAVLPGQHVSHSGWAVPPPPPGPEEGPGGSGVREPRRPRPPAPPSARPGPEDAGA